MYVSAACDAERDLGDRARRPVADERRRRRRRPPRRRADGEDEAARDRVAVGGDHAVGRDVRPVGRPGFSPTASSRPCRRDARSSSSTPAFASKTRTRAEVALDGLVEASTTSAARLQGRAAPRASSTSRTAWARAAGGRARAAPPRGAGRERRAAARPASAVARRTSPGLRAGLAGGSHAARPGGGGARRPRRRRRGARRREADEHAGRRAAARSAPEQRARRSRSLRRPAAAPSSRRSSCAGRVGDLRRVVSPIQCMRWSWNWKRPVAADDLPPRRRRWSATPARAVAEALVVEVDRRRAHVDLDTPPPAAAHVVLPAVAVDATVCEPSLTKCKRSSPLRTSPLNPGTVVVTGDEGLESGLPVGNRWVGEQRRGKRGEQGGEKWCDGPRGGPPSGSGSKRGLQFREGAGAS